MPKNRDWDDMTADEKANSLRNQLDNVVDQINMILSRLGQRLSSIEEDSKQHDKND